MAIRARLTERRPQLGVRYTQLAVSVAFLVLMAWSNANRGYWEKNDLTGPLALASIAFALTLVMLVYSLYTLHRGVVAMGGSKWFVRVPVELLFVLLWGGSAGLMAAQPKGYDHDATRWWKSPPTVEWGLAIAFGWLEFLLFLLTAVIVFLETRYSGKSGTGAAYV
ncbi:MAG: hypothetical protein M4579_002198 [Chaenotheca gracillima]|nr:MAG: hypothetical protein M4579_002198 [Chaenotheca gracillima]